MKKLLSIPLLIAALLAGMQSCQYEYIMFEEVDIPEEVSFANDIVPIFERGCNTNLCHGGNADPDLRPDNAYNSLINGGYVNVDSPEESSIYTTLLPGGSMEQYAEPGEKDFILAWIEQGAKNN
jgi:hypothetical protein